MTIATVSIVTLAKPTKLTTACSTREFSVGVPTLIRIVESTDFRHIRSADTRRTSRSRYRGLPATGWGPRGPPRLWMPARALLPGVVLQLSPGLCVSAGPYYPYLTVWVRRRSPFQVRRNAPAIADWPFPPDSGPQIPYQGRQWAYFYPHPCLGKHPSCGECDLSGSARALLLLLSALSLSG